MDKNGKQPGKALVDAGVIEGHVDVLIGEARDLPTDILRRDTWFTTQVIYAKKPGQTVTNDKSPKFPLGVAGTSRGQSIEPFDIRVGGSTVVDAGGNWVGPPAGDGGQGPPARAVRRVPRDLPALTAPPNPPDPADPPADPPGPAVRPAPMAAMARLARREQPERRQRMGPRVPPARRGRLVRSVRPRTSAICCNSPVGR